MKKLILLITLIFSQTLLARGAVQYSEAADVFEIVDNVSLWHNKVRPEYRKHWERTFGALGNDVTWFNDYAEIRKRYSPQDPNAGVKDIFGTPGIKHSFFANAFYSSSSVSQALKKLSKKLKKEDIAFLSKFFKHFLPKISQMVKESTTFKQKTIVLSDQWRKSKVPALLKKLAKHLDIKIRSKNDFKVIPVWWPKNEKPMVESRANYLILRYHPLEQANDWDVSEVIPQAINAMLQAQPSNQRQNLTKIFQGQCNGRGLEFVDSLKILWGKMLVQKWKEKKKFSLYQIWDNRPFVNLYVKVLFPMLEEDLKNKGTIAGKFIHQAAVVCSEIHHLSR